MQLGELVQGTGVELEQPGHASLRICDVTEDSRTALPGSLFIARPGLKSDGRTYIADAIRAGASAVLTVEGAAKPEGAEDVAWLTTDDIAESTALIAERFFGEPGKRLMLLGVTGTNGKTTVSYLMHQLLRAAKVRTGLIGTVFIDDGAGLSASVMTTPPALEVSHALSRMIDHGYCAASLEVSSHSLEQKRVAALRFNAAVFTNLTGDHLDYHGTMENYAGAKAKLFEMLRPGGAAVVNIDDPAAETMVKNCRERVLRCTMEQDRRADCSARARNFTVSGFDGEFIGPWGRVSARVPLIGEHNAMNVLQAIAAVHAAGVSLEKFEEKLEKLVSPPGRMELVTSEWTAAKSIAGSIKPAEPFSVFVDYSHSDDSLEKALAALRSLVTKKGAKLRVVFGCGGDRDRTKRPRMGRVAAAGADQVIVTSDNPRTEEPSAIIREVLSGVPREAMGKVHVDADRRAGISRAIDDSCPGDIVLIAGKGHEDYQLVPDGAGGILRLSFDDRMVAREALLRRAAHEADPSHTEPAHAGATVNSGGRG
ncbi:MAG TPA: UDP-N-acetylmuramoyl-L-alanyl-D-glutamate--2,6-diaminopimelate ligase [Phycisphaerales bacterium]|nr:UDP-N-acetylmuramoyl-L-alanyl-D-glutamate--2,6-diaminopimelate ligase [Phycisphaerales bacterium]